MAEFLASSGPSFTATPVASKGYSQVTIINQSNHNCTGGIISLRSTSGEFQQLSVGYISIGGQQSLGFNLNGQPSLLGWDLASDAGPHWGPGLANVNAASFPATCPLQPF